MDFKTLVWIPIQTITFSKKNFSINALGLSDTKFTEKIFLCV